MGSWEERGRERGRERKGGRERGEEREGGERRMKELASSFVVAEILLVSKCSYGHCNRSQ